MANTVNCTIVGQHFSDIVEDHSYDAEYAYAGVLDDATIPTCYVYCMKFTTPAFIGQSSKISMGMSLCKSPSERVNIRWALCTSDANYGAYLGYHAAIGEVTDPSQIAIGDQTMEDLDYAYKTYTIEIDTTEIQPNTTYYFYLWGYNVAYAEGLVLGIDTIANHSVVITYDGGAVVFIDNGTSFDAYEVYIDNGSSWDRYEPYMDNGSGWNPCGSG